MSQNLKLKATANNAHKVITNIKETQERKGGMGKKVGTKGSYVGL
jgi:hypothetical protein